MCARRVQLLGPVQVLDDAADVPRFRSQRTMTLLGYLVTERRSFVRETLATLFYPDESLSKGRGKLRRELHNLSRILPDCWAVDRRHVRFLPNSKIDIDLYALLVHEQAERWAAAADLVNGEFLAGIVVEDNLELDAWLQSERRRWRRQSTTILMRLAGQLSDERLYTTAIDVAERLLRLDPLQEDGYRLLMRLQALNGDYIGVQRAYEQCVSVLQSELGVDPAPNTIAVAERLARRARALAGSKSVDATHPGGEDETLSLVGRHAEWRDLVRHWHGVEGGRPHVVLVSGEAGIGKTRLIEELEMRIDRQGFMSAFTRCYEGEDGLSYSPVVAWLRSAPVQSHLNTLDDVWLLELSRLLPELRAQRPGLPAPMPISQGWQRQQLFEAMAHALLAVSQPMLLVLDDIQWCDVETLDWLRFLLHFAPQAPVLVAATQRVEDVAPDHPLARWRFEVQRSRQFTEIELGPLSEAESVALGEEAAGHQLDSDLQKALVRETEGHPLFIVETIRADVLRSEVGDDTIHASVVSMGPHATRRFLPPTILGVIESRLNQLTPRTRDLIALAAVIGRSFSVDLLAAVGDDEPTALTGALEEAWHRRIIREQSAHTYDFSHDRIREVAYASMSGTRRVLRHRLVAEALRRNHDGNLDAVSHDLALHYERAGMVNEAITFHDMAAKSARQIYANETAIYHLRRALDLLSSLPDTPQRARRELGLQNELGPSLLAAKGIGAPELGETYARVRALWQALGQDAEHAPLLWGQTSYLNTRSELREARRLGERLLETAERNNNSGEIVMACRGLGATYAHQGELTLSQELFNQALDLYDPDTHREVARQLGNDPGIVCLCFGMINLWLLGHEDQALSWSRRSHDLAEQLSSPFHLAWYQVFTAWLHILRRDVTAAAQEVEYGFRLTLEHDLAQMHAMARIFQGWTTAQVGQLEDGIRDLRGGIENWRATGAEIASPHWLGLLAEQCLRAERYDETAACLAEALAIIKETGERRGEAELLRLQGMLALTQSGDAAAAEALFQQAIDVARSQRALSWELRTALCLGRLWRKEGREQAAHALVADVYQRFSQGVDTPDLKDARNFLE